MAYTVDLFGSHPQNESEKTITFEASSWREAKEVALGHVREGGYHTGALWEDGNPGHELVFNPDPKV